MQGNILESNAKIIAYGASCNGYSKNKIVKLIKREYPYVHKQYMDLVKSEDYLLGKVHLSNIIGTKQYLATMFIEDQFGIFKKTYPNIYAIDKCFNQIANMVKNENSIFYNKTVAIPYGIGTGKNGFYWDDTIFPMIKKVFHGVNVELCKPYE